ncbi:hypothetical protein ABZ027_30175 [Streptomyces sp. NPDC006332]|uniref:hypothetical protein n=1 Tax=Streptomyces sp. NPDC006332 TaxID=3155456 RepID=UPI0033A5CFA6
MARVVDVLTVGGGQERGDTHVDADHGPCRGQRFGLGLLSGQDDVPALAFALDGTVLTLPTTDFRFGVIPQ